ncbi:hypothetical protein, conserved [Babesia bigemina]|uniref:CWF21 domain-containing protein n=1 Tax=Babesia bigemina TaxID=5866 RepID=A0A061D4C7_BABBI|nr:hypothetical protein, conserved [Babesia bigemina]CDR95433.1 hypothetical protein, conserved [Babesia bigemina]|eukprot:XP_012767619.1 hypothetical protein, conserved [Babesia bigemina]
MFNGVGLTTPRGSGTNGYVQKSLATLRPVRIAKGHDQQGVITRPKLRTNPEIALHEKLRALEVKLLELRVLKEGQMSTEELDKLIANERQRLMKLLEQDSMVYDRRENDSNQLAEDKARRNQKMKEALKIKDTDHGAKPRDVEAEDQGTSLGERDEIDQRAHLTVRIVGTWKGAHRDQARHIANVDTSKSTNVQAGLTPPTAMCPAALTQHVDKDTDAYAAFPTQDRVHTAVRPANATPIDPPTEAPNETECGAGNVHVAIGAQAVVTGKEGVQGINLTAALAVVCLAGHRPVDRTAMPHTTARYRAVIRRNIAKVTVAGVKGIGMLSQRGTKQYIRIVADHDQTELALEVTKSNADAATQADTEDRYSSRKCRRSSSSSVSSSPSPHETRRAELRHRDSRKSKSSSRSRSRTHDRHSRSLSRAPGNYERNDGGSATDSSMEHSDG